jgi:hypothetical protein
VIRPRTDDSSGEAELFWTRIVRNHNHSAKRKNSSSAWNASETAGTPLKREKPEVIDFRHIPVHKMPCKRPTGFGLPSSEIYPP